MYRKGRGVPRDDAEAARWYRAAAEQGCAAAVNNLGVLTMNGWGVPRDVGAALALYRTAAQQGQQDARSNLARHLDGKSSTAARGGEVRRAPADGAEVVGTVVAGETLAVVDTRGEWHQIFVEETGLTGWVRADLFQARPDFDDTAPPGQAEAG